jgi:endoglucanase Acf2
MNDKSAKITPRSLVNMSTLEALPKASRSSAITDRIGKDVLFPPTNSWISGMVLQKEPNPVFPMPYSFKPTTSGFEMNLPTVTSTNTEILGQHAPSLSVMFGATNFSLISFDGVVAKLRFVSADKPIADVTIASGSPYIFYESLSDSTITLTGAEPTATSQASARFVKDGKQYFATTLDGATITKDGATTITAPQNSLVTFYALPNDTPDTLKTHAGNVLESVDMSYKNTDDTVTTVLDYATRNQKQTYFAAMSYHSIPNMQSVMSYDSIYGQMPVYEGTSFSLTARSVPPSNSLDLGSLSTTQKQSLIATLKEDIKTTQFTAKDSYFGGKQLARAANLLDIAHQLDQTALADELQQKLTNAFADRLNNDYFYYDTKLKGVAANTAAFGSEDFNDHHFHYGYFIYAASILGKYDEEFVANHGDYIDLLAADIGNYDKNDKYFPLRRNFDPYASHSWAAGLAPFADGNNQESSSEAMQAWNALALWGDVTKNDDLRKSGRWLLAQETATAAKAWRQVDATDKQLQNYTSPLTSLSFGGKRTYSTFFSDEPNAKLAIQIIPANPMMTVFTQDEAKIAKQVNVAIKDNNFNVTLGDYVLMYSALGNPERASQALSQQQSKFIDDGNSRTYLNAWVYSLSTTR